MNSDESLRRLLHDAARPDVDEALEAALDEAARETTSLTDDTVARMMREATQISPHSPLCGPKAERPRTAQRTVRTTLWALAAAASVMLGFTWLTQKQPPSIPAETLATKAHERRVERLKDDSLLYLDENTRVTITSAREIKLEAGCAYVEVARQLSADGKRIPFTMHTPSGPVTALGTKFAVDVSSGKPEVLVTEGKVTATGLAQPLLAGQWWRGNGIESAPQAVHGLGWTREMRMMLAPPPVPPSQDMGGALRSTDGSAVFTLRRCHVDVHVEDGMARTTIDQTYFNHLPSRQEGTFYFPLPADASISRLAMYVNGKLMEGGMAEREEARRTFETIKHKMQDPALLEWVDGSTFKMRVFPLEGREEKRIVISYVQKLDTLHGRSTLRVPLGHSLGKTGQWSFITRIKDGRDAAWRSLHHDLKTEVEGSDLLLRTDKAADTMQRDVVLEIASPESTAPRLSSYEHEGARYVALRWTPDLPAALPPPSRHWLFLIEMSADRDRVLAQTQREVLRGILNQASADDTFRIITASTRTTELVPTQPVTAANRDAALLMLAEQTNLGALDLGQAFRMLEREYGEAYSPLERAGSKSGEWSATHSRSVRADPRFPPPGKSRSRSASGGSAGSP
jgi:ferric-dicitrate binding protein FerR (iron transport regulator)